jgi:hypothetical protein
MKNHSNNHLNILLTFDTDLPFTSDFNKTLKDATLWRKQMWQDRTNLASPIESISAIREDNILIDSDGKKPVFTWFVRADNEFDYLFKDALFVIKNLKDQLVSLKSKGDEIAWHPHVHNISEKGFNQEKDETRVIDDLNHTFKLLKDECFLDKFNIRSSRLGWGFCTNKIIKNLEELGISVDSSALPERVDSGKECKDWTGTPLHPYFPSTTDYRVETGTAKLDIIEMPITTHPIKTSYDKMPIIRYLNLSYNLDFLKPILSKLVAELDFINFITHPFELESSNRKHELITYDIKNAKNLIRFLVEECKRQKRPFRFITISEVCEYAT